MIFIFLIACGAKNKTRSFSKPSAVDVNSKITTTDSKKTIANKVVVNKKEMLSKSEKATNALVADILNKTNNDRLTRDAALQLLEQVEDINEPVKDGLTLLHLAVLNNRQDMCEWLLENGIDINIQDEQTDNTALHFSVIAENTEIRVLLIDKGANQELENKEGENPEELFNRLEQAKIDAMDQY